MTRPADFRSTVRRGTRVPTAHTILHVLRGGEGPARFGFIVTKDIGGAVLRNTIRRRMRAVCYAALPDVAQGTDVVIRALPGSGQLTYATLQSEIVGGLERSAA